MKRFNGKLSGYISLGVSVDRKVEDDEIISLSSVHENVRLRVVHKVRLQIMPVSPAPHLRLFTCLCIWLTLQLRLSIIPHLALYSAIWSGSVIADNSIQLK